MKLIIAVAVFCGLVLLVFVAKINKPFSKPGDPPAANSATKTKSEWPSKPPAERPAMPLANTNAATFTNLYSIASYSMGMEIAGSIKLDGVAADYIEVDYLVMGLRDGLVNYMPLVEATTAKKILEEFQEEMKKKAEQKALQEAEANKRRGEEFLALNKSKEDIITTSSGLQYRIIREGKGESPNEDDRIAMHFRSRTIDDVEFNSSYKHKAPIVIPMRGVIPAWREALLKMKPGAKWELFVHPDLAYGAREVGKNVGPYSTVIFELELVRIEKQESQ